MVLSRFTNFLVESLMLSFKGCPVAFPISAMGFAYRNHKKSVSVQPTSRLINVVEIGRFSPDIE